MEFPGRLSKQSSKHNGSGISSYGESRIPNLIILRDLENSSHYVQAQILEVRSVLPIGTISVADLCNKDIENQIFALFKRSSSNSQSISGCAVTVDKQ